MMMPNTDRNDRSLCNHRLRSASEKLRRPFSVENKGKNARMPTPPRMERMVKKLMG